MNQSGGNQLDSPLVEHWLHVNTARWMAGALAGLLAGLMAMAFAMILSSIGGIGFWFPAKLMATICAGAGAMDFDSGAGAVISGLLFFEILAAFFGIIFSHFTYTNHLLSLLGMGCVWGTFSWIFIWCLFFQSFRTIFVAQVSPAAAFPAPL